LIAIVLSRRTFKGIPFVDSRQSRLGYPLGATGRIAYLDSMAVLDSVPGIPERRETEVERHARVWRERALVAQAEADIDAGLGVEWAEVEAWLHQLDRDENASPPEPRRPDTRRP
jgi:hypothetical protein